MRERWGVEEAGVWEEGTLGGGAKADRRVAGTRGGAVAQASSITPAVAPAPAAIAP